MRHDGFEAPGSPISSSQHSSDSGPSSRSLWLHKHAENGLRAHLAALQSEIFVRCGTPDKNKNNRYYTGQKEAEHYSLTPPPPFVFDPFGLEDYTTSVLHDDDGTARIPGRDNDPIVPRNFAERHQSVEPIVPLSSLKSLDENWDWIQHWANNVHKAMMGTSHEMDVPPTIQL